MKIYADGIVTNEYNEALFILRSDSRTWAQPGGAIEFRELPTDGLAREVEEETGLKVMPVRLVGLYYRPHEKPDGLLLLTFRCIMRGGQLRTSDESLQVGFLPASPLPGPMLGVHKERLQRALQHRGGPPYWGLQSLSLPVRLGRRLVYGAKDLARRLRGEEPFQPPPDWEVGAFVVLRDADGRVLWVKRTDYDVWNIPGGARQGREAPWQTAQREAREETGLAVQLTDLSGVYVKPDTQQLILTFTGVVTGGQLALNQEAAEFAYYKPGEEPGNCLPKQVERVADAVASRQTTMFRIQSGSTDLQELAQLK